MWVSKQEYEEGGRSQVQALKCIKFCCCEIFSSVEEVGTLAYVVYNILPLLSSGGQEVSLNEALLHGQAIQWIYLSICTSNDLI